MIISADEARKARASPTATRRRRRELLLALSLSGGCSACMTTFTSGDRTPGSFNCTVQLAVSQDKWHVKLVEQGDWHGCVQWQQLRWGGGGCIPVGVWCSVNTGTCAAPSKSVSSNPVALRGLRHQPHRRGVLPRVSDAHGGLLLHAPRPASLPIFH